MFYFNVTRKLVTNLAGAVKSFFNFGQIFLNFFGATAPVANRCKKAIVPRAHYSAIATACQVFF
tara:strand:- start:2143 stop:2334 length:192 start_codon:yes stop_codon:yes gene_type:complete